jgi:hypothetical protein
VDYSHGVVGYYGEVDASDQGSKGIWGWVYNIQNYRVPGRCAPSGILNTRTPNNSVTGSVPILR